MLFDEPTSALDPEMIAEVLDVMSELAGGNLLIVKGYGGWRSIERVGSYSKHWKKMLA